MPTLREKYFLQLLRMKHLFSLNSESPLRLPLKIPSAPKLLLCLPENEDYLKSVQNHLPSFRRIFAPGIIYLVVERSFEGSFAHDSIFQTLPFSKTDFSSMGVLKKPWMAQLPKDIFLAIDFNRVENLWSGYLCFSTRAPVRISLKKPRMSNFFNIILNPNQENTFQEQVTYLLQMIQAITQTSKES